MAAVLGRCQGPPPSRPPGQLTEALTCQGPGATVREFRGVGRIRRRCILLTVALSSLRAVPVLRIKGERYGSRAPRFRRGAPRGWSSCPTTPRRPRRRGRSRSFLRFDARSLKRSRWGLKFPKKVVSLRGAFGERASNLRNDLVPAPVSIITSWFGLLLVDQDNLPNGVAFPQ